MYYSFSFCIALTHVQDQLGTHCHLLLHASFRGIYNTSAQSWFPEHNPLLQQETPLLPRHSHWDGVQAVYRQNSWECKKGHLEVTVSAQLSGWPPERGGVGGGGDCAHRGIVCCCAGKKKNKKQDGMVHIRTGDTMKKCIRCQHIAKGLNYFLKSFSHCRLHYHFCV